MTPELRFRATIDPADALSALGGYARGVFCANSLLGRTVSTDILVAGVALIAHGGSSSRRRRRRVRELRR